MFEKKIKSKNRLIRKLFTSGFKINLDIKVNTKSSKRSANKIKDQNIFKKSCKSGDVKFVYYSTKDYHP